MDAAGNVIIAGDFWGGIDFGGSLLKSSGDRDIFIAKFDRNGRHQWSQRFGDPAEQVAVGVQVDSTGSIFLASAFTGTLDFGGTPLVSKGRYSIALAKLDPDGRHLWSRSFGEGGYYVPECLAVTANGRAVVAGRFVGSLDFGGGKIACQSAQTDIFVAAVSPKGDYIWAKRFGGPYEQQTRSIAVDSSGRIALTGVFKGSISFDDCKLSEDRPDEYCGFLAKLDEHGKTIWCKRLGDPSAEQGSVVSFDHANGDIIAAGFIRNKLPPQVSGQFESLCSLARYDASGILQWSKTFGVCAFPDSISVNPGGDILLTGHFRLTVDFGLGPLVSEGGYDIFAAMFSSDGAPLWSARFGDARQQFLVQGVHAPDGLVALAGSFHGTIDFGSGPLVASGYDGVSEGAEDLFLALLVAGRVSPQPSIAGTTHPRLEAAESDPEESGISRVKRVGGGGLVALFVALVLGALTVFGIINVNLGHLLLFLAWAVGVIVIFTELMSGKTAKQKLLAALALSFLFAAADWGILKLKSLQDTPAQPVQHGPHGVEEEPKAPQDAPQPENKPAADSSVSPVAQLSELGWTVRPGTDSIQFEIANKPLPPMKESAAYFGQLKKPFHLHFQGIKGIEGLHHLAGITGCTKIEINAGEFTDISELRSLVNLTSLVISQTPINGLAVVDIAPISSLTNLRELNLFSTKANSIEGFGRLKKLKTLNLKDTLVPDLSPISGIASLESLDITGTRMSDLSALSHDQNLKELGIGGAQIPGLGKLATLKNLKTLRIIEQSNIDLAPVGTLTNLEYLWIWGPPQFNASPLRNLTKLRELSLTGIGFGGVSATNDIEVLGDLKELRKLTLGFLQVSDVTFVNNLKNLSEVNIDALPISSVAPLRGLTSLRSVSLVQTPVVDISPLLDLPVLTNLTVIRTPARADVLTELERRGVKVVR